MDETGFAILEPDADSGLLGMRLRLDGRVGDAGLVLGLAAIAGEEGRVDLIVVATEGEEGRIREAVGDAGRVILVMPGEEGRLVVSGLAFGPATPGEAGRVTIFGDWGLRAVTLLRMALATVEGDGLFSTDWMFDVVAEAARSSRVIMLPVEVSDVWFGALRLEIVVVRVVTALFSKDCCPLLFRENGDEGRLMGVTVVLLRLGGPPFERGVDSRFVGVDPTQVPLFAFWGDSEAEAGKRPGEDLRTASFAEGDSGCFFESGVFPGEAGRRNEASNSEICFVAFWFFIIQSETQENHLPSHSVFASQKYGLWK